MGSKRSDRWMNAPTSTEHQPDAVPSRSLPPRSSLERMPGGERLGLCPDCGNDHWWDNLARKRMRELDADEPDFACTECRHGRWLDGHRVAGRPGVRRRPAMTTTRLAPVEIPSDAATARCAGRTKNGAPCGNAPMAGDVYCGPHSSHTTSSTCRGTTKSGAPCRAGAQRGSRYCPQHQP